MELKIEAVISLENQAVFTITECKEIYEKRMSKSEWYYVDDVEELEKIEEKEKENEDYYIEYQIEKGRLKRLTLTVEEETQLTNELFFGSAHDTFDGDEYTQEWVAEAHDENGELFKVYWNFDVLKGSEPDKSQLKFEDESKIVKIELL